MDNKFKLNSKIYSRLGQRGAIFGMALIDAAKNDKEILVLTADLKLLSGLDRFSKMFPEQFINTGIAEQNMIGIAAGLSAEGHNVISTTYATFITLRSCEQVRHFQGYMNLKNIIIGSGAGLVQAFSGNTHYSLEDLSIMRTIPGMTVLSPSDADQAVKLFNASLSLDTPVYIRLSGGLNCPVVYKNDYDIRIGEVIKICDGDDIVIFATGFMTHIAVKVAKFLAEKGIHSTVIDVHTIKPLDPNIHNYIKGKKLSVTIEEHNIIGGLGGAISEHLSARGANVPLLRLGIQDKFTKVGDHDFLLAENRLSTELIIEDILENFYVEN